MTYETRTWTSGGPSCNLEFHCTPKEPTMNNLERDYDAVEGKGKTEPRPIGRGDVLRGGSGKHYLLTYANGRANLVRIENAEHFTEPISVENLSRLTRK